MVKLKKNINKEKIVKKTIKIKRSEFEIIIIIIKMIMYLLE
jgi:hypothetical protein